ncbi:UPF0711 protein C18orf21 homolog isoform X1 [Clinocottus analis]|uniref:UPF0711 protein C18orf21 homolog isoform X1 n=1 Tax=Clinocottus analis TaxID=304258 RepID=UPI0035C1B207
MKTIFEGKSVSFLLDASLLYKDTCPELSRFFLQWPVKAKAPAKQKSSRLLQSTSACSYCYQWLQPDNHRVRLRPKRRPSARVQSVLRRKARGKRLSLVQRNLLQRFQKSCSVLMATCHTCSKTSRHNGVNREFMATHGTPGSAGKHKTPQSTHRANMTTPKTPSKDKTPAHTPRSSTSSNTPGSGSSSSKTPSKPKHWVVQRLSKILMRQDNQTSKKGGLKDFLSSL